MSSETTSDSESWAFWCFVAACGLGVILFLFGSVGRLAPILVTVAYGAALHWNRTRSNWVLSETVRDSPYFLGFLLTQVSLAVVFWRFSGQVISGNPGTLHRLIQDVAVALLSSVAGLFMRHWLMAFDTTSARQRKGLDQLEADLRRNAEAYHDAQIGFVSLVDRMKTEHEQLQNEAERLRRERQVAEKQSSEAFVQGLNELGAAFRTTADALVAELGRSAGILTQATGAVAATVTNAAGSLPDFEKVLREHRQVLLTATSEFNRAVASLSEELLGFARRLPLDQSGEKLKSAFDKLSQAIGEASPTTALRNLAAGLAESSKELREFTQETKKGTKQMAGTQSGLSTFKQDLDAIDTLLTEFSDAVIRNIENLGPTAPPEPTRPS